MGGRVEGKEGIKWWRGNVRGPGTVICEQGKERVESGRIAEEEKGSRRGKRGLD